MKRKLLILAAIVVLAGAGFWAVRAARRGDRQLITLDVRNMPLREVLKKVERQAGTGIRAEQSLDARITLKVSDKPVSYVLDRIADQAGARWSTLYAVYGSSAALQALESSLSGDGKVPPADWTKLAPNHPEFDGAMPERVVSMLPPGANVPPGNSAKEGKRMMMMKRGTGGPGGGSGATVIQSAGGEVEMWSPEELIMQSSLTNRLEAGQMLEPTSACASLAAERVKGEWTTYFAFCKSKVGMAFNRPRPGKQEFGPNPNDHFARLTPEQRVLRARERMKSKTGERVVEINEEVIRRSTFSK